MLGVDGSASRTLQTGRGALPGCPQSMSWVKVNVHEALEACQCQLAVARAYVDDIAPDVAGWDQELQAHLLPAAVRLAPGIEQLGLALSTESALA
eukprot:5645751-Pyramimonas_sp.AAC.1